MPATALRLLPGCIDGSTDAPDGCASTGMEVHVDFGTALVSWRGDVHVVGHGGHDGHAEAEPFAVSVGQHPASSVGDHNPQRTTMLRARQPR